jgi:hypothetical protein
MRVLIAVLGLSILGGCSSTKHSTLPPFVRDLKPAAGGLEMVQCETVLTTTREYSFLTDSTRTTRAIASGACWQQVISTEPPAGEPAAQPITMNGGAR